MDMNNIHVSLNKIEYVMAIIHCNLCNNAAICVYLPFPVAKTPLEKAKVDIGTT